MQKRKSAADETEKSRKYLNIFCVFFFLWRSFSEFITYLHGSGISEYLANGLYVNVYKTVV